jgi:flagellar M-ring protein FliF
VRESHTRNYEIDHVSEKRTIGGGALRRLTVAVVLDGVKGDKGMVARPREELDKLTALVRSAAGASDGRGDVVTVESIPFASNVDAAEASPPPAPVAPPTKLELAKRWAPAGAGAVVLLLVAGLALRGRRAGPKPTTLEQLTGMPTPASLEAAVSAPVLDSGDLRAQALSRATQDPATAALVLRFWLGTSATEQREPAPART